MRYIASSIGVVLFITGIIMPVMVNGIKLSILFNLSMITLVLVVNILFYNFATVSFKYPITFVEAFENKIFETGSIVAMIVGLLIGSTQVILNFTESVFHREGHLLVIFSLLYGFVFLQFFRILRSFVEFRKISIEDRMHFKEKVLFSLFFAFSIVTPIVVMHINKFNIEKVFYIEDFFAFFCLFLGSLGVGNNYKIVNLWFKGKNEKVILVTHLKDVMLTAIFSGVIVSIIRSIVLLMNIDEYKYYTNIIGIVLFPIIYGVIIGLLIFKPMQYRTKTKE